jgi:hypothetical protein
MKYVTYMRTAAYRYPLTIAALVTLSALTSSCGAESARAAGARQPLPDPAEMRAVSGATAPAASASTNPGLAPLREQRMIEAALAKVEQNRGLKAKAAVPGHVLSRTAMLDKVKEHLAKEVPDSVILREGRVLQLLGLVPLVFDYKAAMFALLEEQLAGFYAPEDGTMYLAQDLEGDMAEATLFHELVHALQDQTWNLKANAKYKPGEGDLSFARSALAEGDATSSMLDPLLAKNGVRTLDIPDDKAEQLILGAATQAGPKATPAIMQHSLVAPYATGLRFVNALRRKGGWSAVNEAWAAPPKTSEQILHQAKFATHEPALDVKAPTAVALGPGFQVKDEDTNGELGFALMFDEFTGKKTPGKGREAARDWGGDRMTFFEKEDQVALAMRLDYDAAQGKYAARAFEIVSRGLTEMLGAPKAKTANFVCFERPDTGPLSIARKGDRIAFTVGPAKVSGDAWSSSANCTVVATWSKEVAE